MPEQGPPQRQRVAAYAVILDDDRRAVLMARLASHVHHDLWTLPGGGIDHGEHPRDAVRREVYEETGLHVEPGALLEVSSRHFTGARPDGRIEDFHGVGLIFAAEVLPQSRGVEPHVVEVDGSTADAAWVPLAELAGLPVAATAALALNLLLDRAARDDG